MRDRVAIEKERKDRASKSRNRKSKKSLYSKRQASKKAAADLTLNDDSKNKGGNDRASRRL